MSEKLLLTVLRVIAVGRVVDPKPNCSNRILVKTNDGRVYPVADPLKLASSVGDAVCLSWLIEGRMFYVSSLAIEGKAVPNDKT